MSTAEFKKEYVDIVVLLNSTIAVGDYRGREVWAMMEGLISRVPDGTLVMIDLKPATFLNSMFCGPAFGPMFCAGMDQRRPRKYVIFEMYDFSRPSFFYGIMLYLGHRPATRKESEARFVSFGMCAKLVIGDQELIHFVGSLNENEQIILDAVNELAKVTSAQVVGKTGLPAESVVDALRSLAQKRFVVERRSQARDGCYYCSFYNYLTRRETQP